MDLRSCFENSAKPSTKVLPSNSSSSEEESDVPLAKRPCVTTSRPELRHQGTGNSRRKYQRRWEKEFNWLEYNADSEGAFCKHCKTSGKALERIGGVWTTRPFKNWKKAIEKMKAHAQSEGHIRARQEASA